jgi:uncharacterized protein (DUF1697 family)
MRYVVLLRGVNVGGVKVTMAPLRAALAAAGFSNVTTLLASGNVLLESADDRAAVKAVCERVLRDTFTYDAWVLVYTVAEIQAIVDAYPFVRVDDVQHPYVIFSEDGVSSSELAAVDGVDAAVEQVQLGPHGVLYWQVDRGSTIGSVIGKASARARYKSTTTTRNLRTVEKLLHEAPTAA